MVTPVRMAVVVLDPDSTYVWAAMKPTPPGEPAPVLHRGRSKYLSEAMHAAMLEAHGYIRQQRIQAQAENLKVTAAAEVLMGWSLFIFLIFIIWLLLSLGVQS